MKTNASIPQPKPKPGNDVIYKIVIKDVEERAEEGLRKYGTHLQANNGRDPLWDAYQEAIDLVQYLRQAIYERDGN